MPTQLPAHFVTVAQLEQQLSEPTPQVLETVRHVPGDVIVLGAGGKMGLSLTTMLRRASEAVGSRRRVLAVSRFTRPGQAEAFHAAGIETRAGDLLDPQFLGQLPRLPNLIFMTGVKFGTGHQAALTWAMNVLLPARVCEHFAPCRVLAFSTGNVYAYVSPESGGSRETDTLQPVGEYGMTAVGRERIFEYYSQQRQIPVTIARLNYAVEMRYGVLVDLAKQVAAEQPVDLSMSHANVIWQGDANALALAAWADASCPPTVVNIAGSEIFSVRSVCERLGERLGKSVRFVNDPQPLSLLNNGTATHACHGSPRVALVQLIDWIADWIASGRPTWDKPTRFENRSGTY